MGDSSYMKAQFQAIGAEKRVVAICFFIALSQFQYGYDSAAVAGFQSMPGFLIVFGYSDPENPIGYNISTRVQTLVQSLIQLGSLVACIIIFGYGQFFHGRIGLWIAGLASIVSVGIMVGSKHLAALYVGRFLLGFSNGFYTTYSAIYMGEASPSYLRGPIVGMIMFQVSFGALIGILVDNYMQTNLTPLSYQVPLAVTAVIPVVVSIGLIFLPESPRHYIMKGNESKAATAITKLRGITDTTRIQEDIRIMKEAWIAETEERTTTSFLDAFRGANLRRTLLSTAASVGQTASGITFIAAFSVYFYVQANIGQPFVWVMVGLTIALTGNMLSFLAIRFVPRRTLLLNSSTINSMLMFGMAIVYTVASPASPAAGKALVALSIIFTWVYGVAQGPVLWAMQAEVPSQKLRSQTVGLAQGINFIFAWLLTYCTPYFINPEALNWGPKYCYIWGGSNLILAVFVFFFIPETKGRSLEQLDELFENRVATRKFAAYVTNLQQPDTDESVVKSGVEVTHVEHRRSEDKV
ncbi:uncharacterized protein HMPREF1541_03038 [Cyphellophora europaea CBS 101466]|uniref:Major facilitator superfamily (MFS) profile domain-containing protein n=1 Tax=Cyphellophora europaea (strain CBS 101466) TaxID=1220924 RepID=W2RZA1_CYPE1|nr:uncharacterized protein HMPREF1541_03038 [Cyphellophora europaea CBS 101466]ETN41103.1 hypothetical protein HMPREF1541_03038 [Cyphellophora europaea CBS 101466]